MIREPLVEVQTVRVGLRIGRDVQDVAVLAEVGEHFALAVRAAETRGCELADLPLNELQKFSALITQDAFDVLSVEGSLAARNHIGGTAPEQVKEAIHKARLRMTVSK